ncbi:MAG: phosphoribosyltransferase [Thermoproteota archaeon]|nr:phosphoribosyltransferase [Thermoproteota archaeon]
MFEAVTRKFQFRFKDRVTAANILSEALKDIIKKDQIPNVIILGIPRGGVITADVVARKLSCKMDIIIPRKLTDPDNKEHAVGAVMEDGTTYLDEELVNQLYITKEYIETEKLHQVEEIKRRTKIYRGDTSSAAADYYSYLKDRTVILVDDGAATGATIIVAARSLKIRFNPQRLIIAVPVAPKDTVGLLKLESDVTEVVTTPSQFHSVGQYYKEFNPVSDEQVIKIMQDRTQLPGT